MESLSNRKDKKEIIREFFSWVLDKNNVGLFEETDLTLVKDYYDPNIYYPQQIADFFNTKAMKRIGRVGQLGLVIKESENCYHSRLEHCKGTYNRKLEELIYLSSNPEYRKYIEENDYKLYLIAELIKEAAHDIGHLPLSHAMEVQIMGRRDFHEDIGKRILLEDEEIRRCT